MLKRITHKDTIKFAWSYWKRRNKLGFFALLFMFLSTMIDVIIPIYAGEIVDAFTVPVSKGKETAVKTIFIFLGLFIGFSILRWMAFVFYNVYECYSMRDILLDALHKVQRFSTD